jgi:hypothetical protein
MTATARPLPPPSRSFGIVKGRAWSAEDYAALRELYEPKGARACAKALPGRSLHSICQAARRLGLGTHRRWTAHEDRILRSEWGYVSVSHLARQLKRTPKAVYQHARVDLQIGMGAPEGSEYVTAASKRTGFDLPTLKRALAAHGIVPRKVPTRPLSRVRFHQHFVDSMDVDDAVAAWMASEYVEPAAAQRGLEGSTLRRWLLRAGVKDTRTIKRGRWRVPTDVIDRVVAEARELESRCESICHGAVRHGILPSRLRVLLIAASLRQTGKPWRLDPNDVDRVVARWRGEERSE